MKSEVNPTIKTNTTRITLRFVKVYFWFYIIFLRGTLSSSEYIAKRSYLY